MNTTKTFQEICSQVKSANLSRQRQRSKQVNGLARKWRRCGNRQQLRLARKLKKALLLHRVIALQDRIEVAGDNSSLMLVGPRNSRLHMVRSSKTLYPRYSYNAERAIRKIGHLIALCKVGTSPDRAAFGDVYDSLDPLLPHFDVAICEQRLKNAYLSCTQGHTNEAAAELRWALGKLRRIRREYERLQPDVGLLRLLESTVAELRTSITKKQVSLPLLIRLCEAIDDGPWTTRRVVPWIKSVQRVARLTRDEKNYSASLDELAELEQVLIPRRRVVTVDAAQKPKLHSVHEAVTPPLAICTDATRLLARMRIVGDLRRYPLASMLADTVGFVESHNGRAMFPRGMTLPHHRACVDVVFDARQENFEMIASRVGNQFAAYSVDIRPLDVTNPAMVCMAVDNHDHATRELSAALADLGCDLTMSLPGFGLGDVNGTVALKYSFTSLLSRPPGVTLDMVHSALRPSLESRGGVLLVSKSCSESLLDNTTEPLDLIDSVTNTEFESSAYESPDSDTRLGRLYVEGKNRVRMLNRCLELLEANNARVFCPVGATTNLGRGTVDVLFEATPAQHTAIKLAASQQLSHMSVASYELDCVNPMVFTVSVTNHKSVTHAITSLLNHLECELVFAAPGFLPVLNGGSPQVSFAYSLTGIVSRPTCMSADQVRTQLEGIARSRGGFAITGRGCRELLLASRDVAIESH